MPSSKSGEVAFFNALAKVRLVILADQENTPASASLPSSPSTNYYTFTMATPSMARDRSPLAVLLDPKTDIPLGERDIRVEDYLNDKIQTSTDMESLESLIVNVEVQKQQLEDQVSN